MSRKKWEITPYDKRLALQLAQETDLDPFAVLLLSARGMRTPEALQAFLEAGTQAFSSPFLLKDMDLAAARIETALERGERILVYGDYDADGVTATALLYSYLLTLGAEADYYIPSRTEDGYGLSLKTAERVLQGGFGLVVTVDNGISALEEAAFLRDHGVDLVVTDHHQAGDTLPDCVAIVDPHRSDDASPCKAFSGVGVALKLCAALEGGDHDTVMDAFGDIAALGTVADIVPLTGENRTLVIRGLQCLRRTDRPGLRALAEVLGLPNTDLSSTDVAYLLAPRINAAGRMGSAETALELLLTEDPIRAMELAKELQAANLARQETETGILEEAEALLRSDPEAALRRFLVVAGKNWHPGVIGIVAARLVEKYGRPVAVASIDAEGVCRGSCRSIEGFSLYDALSAVSGLLTQFGGHTLAAGFSLPAERLPAFTQAINDYAARQGDVYPVLHVDCRLNPAYVNAEILDSLDLLEPFGAENPRPVFGLFDMTITAAQPIGSNRHMRLTVQRNGASLTAVYFGMPPQRFPYRVGDRVDLAVRAEKNEYNGAVRLSLQVRDIRPEGCDDAAVFRGQFLFRRLQRNEPLNDAERAELLPDRALLGSLFKYVKSQENGVRSAEVAAYRMGMPWSAVGAVETGLAALTEIGVLRYEDGAWKDASLTGKADLSASILLRRLGG